MAVVVPVPVKRMETKTAERTYEEPHLAFAITQTWALLDVALAIARTAGINMDIVVKGRVGRQVIFTMNAVENNDEQRVAAHD